MTYFMYGNYQHDNDEVVLTSMEIVPRFSERGMRMETTYRLNLYGELIATGTELLQKIEELATVYSVDNLSAGLYMDDGTPTIHRLPQDDPNNISGVRVVHRAWPVGDAAELATVRTFSIRLEATYRDISSEILYFQEVIRHYGNGGPEWRMQHFAAGPPVPVVIAQQTSQKIEQSGMCVGYDGYPLVRVPRPILPQWEHREQRVFDTLSPHFNGAGFSEYGVRWVYVMEQPTPGTYFPNRL